MTDDQFDKVMAAIAEIDRKLEALKEQIALQNEPPGMKALGGSSESI